MTVTAPTDWRSQATELDARDDAGNVYVWPWLFGSDDAVGVRVALDDGESVTAPSSRLMKLAAQNETAGAEEFAAGINGAPVVVADVVYQRLQSLERGRYYRLEVLHGAAGNRRGAAVLIRCV